MTSNLDAGSVVLEGHGGPVALVWAAEDEDRSRPLPAATYRLRTTRVEREKDGEHWFLSSTGPPGDPVAVAAGKTTRIEVKDEVRFKGLARAHGGSVQLGFQITGADGRGLSVYRALKRVSVTYKLLAADGSVVAQGTMNYG